VASGWVGHIHRRPTMANKITRGGHMRPRIGLVHWIPLLAIWRVGHMLEGGHPPEATPRLWHCKRVSLRAVLRLMRMLRRLWLWLKLVLVLRLRLRRRRRVTARLLLTLRLGRRGGSLALLAGESCLASGLMRLGLLGLHAVGLFPEAGGLQICSHPLRSLGYRVGRPRRDSRASRAILLISGHRRGSP
jgi:hypothetical protein